jgi:hypothetical protein
VTLVKSHAKIPLKVCRSAGFGPSGPNSVRFGSTLDMLFLKSNKYQNLWNSLVIMVLSWLRPSLHEIRRSVGAKIIDIDRQHTPTARLCSPRAIRSKKERRMVSWTQNMHDNYFLAFFAYLGFQVANIFTFVYWSSELVTKIQCEPFFLELVGFSDFRNKANSWMLMVYDSLKAKPLSCMITKVCAHLFHLFCKFKQSVSK